VPDVPARWSTPAWLEEARTWLEEALAARGITATGPVVQHHVRFWSTVLRVDTDAGRVWLKENAPSQSFEASLVSTIHRRCPGWVAEPLAVDEQRGLLATTDLGVPLWEEGKPSAQDWSLLVAEFASLQRALVPHATEVLGSGLPRFPEEPHDVTTWVASVRDELRSLPGHDPRRLTDDEVRAVDAGMHRIADAAAVLAGSGVPSSLQHNDLHTGNAFRTRQGRIAFIDLGDALWTHPLTALRIPLWAARHGLGLGGDDPGVLRILESWQAPWADLVTMEEVAESAPAAERISCLHRAESWRRLQADVPFDAVDDAYRRSVPEWLVDAAAPDPFLSAVAR
jgi:Phosphotransferase enzyme family